MAIIADMLAEVNIMGFGTDPLAIAFSFMIALVINQKEIRSGGPQPYTNFVLTFCASLVALRVVGMSSIVWIPEAWIVTGKQVQS